MNINDSPELIVVQKILGDVIGEGLAKKWGTIHIELQVQNAQIVSVRKWVEQKINNVHQIDPASMKDVT